MKLFTKEHKQQHPLNSCPECGLFFYACKCPNQINESQKSSNGENKQ